MSNENTSATTETTTATPTVDLNNLSPEVKAMVEKILAAKKNVSGTGHSGRPANPNVVHLTCKDCGKVVTYRDTDADKAGLEKRIEKSQMSRDDFMKNFRCRACAGKIRKQAEAIVAAQKPAAEAQPVADSATPAGDQKPAGKKAKKD